MRDLVFLSVVIAFFAVAVAYVSACAWLVGPGEQFTPLSGPAEADDDEVAA